MDPSRIAPQSHSSHIVPPDREGEAPEIVRNVNSLASRTLQSAAAGIQMIPSGSKHHWAFGGITGALVTGLILALVATPHVLVTIGTLLLTVSAVIFLFYLIYIVTHDMPSQQMEDFSPVRARERETFTLSYRDLPPQEEDLGEETICSITQDVPEKPVRYGAHIFDFESLLRWYCLKGTNPITREPLDLRNLVRVIPARTVATQ